MHKNKFPSTITFYQNIRRLSSGWYKVINYFTLLFKEEENITLATRLQHFQDLAEEYKKSAVEALGNLDCNSTISAFSAFSASNISLDKTSLIESFTPALCISVPETSSLCASIDKSIISPTRSKAATTSQAMNFVKMSIEDATIPFATSNGEDYNAIAALSSPNRRASTASAKNEDPSNNFMYHVIDV